MEWNKYIYSNPKILSGKPIIKDTRLSVDHILKLFASGWTMEQVLESYPTLTAESVRAVFAFSAECMEEEILYATDNK